jgi:hypothetical protein
MMVVRVSGSTFSAESLHNIENRVISQPRNMHDNRLNLFKVALYQKVAL